MYNKMRTSQKLLRVYVCSHRVYLCEQRCGKWKSGFLQSDSNKTNRLICFSLQISFKSIKKLTSDTFGCNLFTHFGRKSKPTYWILRLCISMTKVILDLISIARRNDEYFIRLWKHLLYVSEENVEHSCLINDLIHLHIENNENSN